MNGLEHGLSIKLKELPFRVQLFKGVATNGAIDWIITHHPEGTMTTHAIQDENAVRWQIEHGVGRFYSSIAGRPILGLSFLTLSIIDVGRHRSYPLAIVQHLPTTKAAKTTERE